MVLHGVALLDCAWHVPPKPQSFFILCVAKKLAGESPGRVGRLGVPSRRSAGQAYAEQTFFRPPSPPFQPRDFRLPPRELLARELAPDTVVAARPTGGHFGSQIRESVQERQHVLLRHGEKVGVLAFCHGFLKFEPQNATSAKVTRSGKRLCQEGILSGRGFVRKRALPGRNFVRKGFCQEAGSAWKEFCQEGILSGSGLCQEGILSGKVFVRKRALPGRGSQLWSWV